MEVMSVIRLLPENREQINNFVSKVVTAVNEGNVNPLELDVQIKRIEEVCKAIRKQTKEQVIDEANKYDKSFTYAGATITVTERATYDFSNDPECVKLENDLKARKEMLKGLKMQLVDPDTGEVLNPPLVKKSDVLTIKIL